MSTDQIPTPPDTRPRAERRLPAEKLYRALVRRHPSGAILSITHILHSGGSRLPRLRTKRSRSRYDRHVGAKQIEKIEDKRVCALPLVQHFSGPKIEREFTR